MATIHRANASIHYEIQRAPECPEDAPVVVFAHGAGGNSLSWWQQIPHFSDSHRVLTFDHRSFGRSECPPADFSTTHFAPDLLAILDAEGVEKAALVCQSMGGWTGLPLAMQHPERVRCLVLCDTPGGLFDEEIGVAMAKTGERIQSAGIQANAALAPEFPKRRPEMAHLYSEISGLNTGVDRSALSALFREEARIAPAELADYRVPTLVLAGGHDLLFPLETMRHVASLIPGALLSEFPESGHSIYFEEPAEFNRQVGAFLAKHA